MDGIGIDSIAMTCPGSGEDGRDDVGNSCQDHHVRAGKVIGLTGKIP